MSKSAEKIKYEPTGQRMMREKCIVLSLSLGRPGMVRKVDMEVKETTEEKADGSRFHHSKSIMESSKVLDKVWSLHSKLKRYVWKKCLPAPLKTGLYLLPISLLDDVNNQLKAFKSELKDLVVEFEAELPKVIEQDNKDLGKWFHKGDYPTTTELSSLFYIEDMYIDFDVPEGLRRLDPDLFREQQRAADKMWDQAAADASQYLRETFQEMVDRMVDRLGKDDKGESRTFRDTLISNIKEFLDDFDKRNIAGDEQLFAIVKRARAALGGVNADALRKKLDLREQVREKFQDVQANIKTVMKKSARTVDFE